MTAPGISLEAVIDQMNLRSLTQLLGEELISTLEKLDGSSPSLEKLRQVAKVFYAGNNPEAILQLSIRNIFLYALSIGKAIELCDKLEVSRQGNVYKELSQLELERGSAELQTVLDFFGIVVDPVAPSIHKPSVEAISPDYSLFAHQRDVASRATETLKREPRRVLVHMPTGAGKTRTAMHIIANYLIENEETVVCWLANSAELLEQAAEEVERSWGVLGNRPIDLYRFWGNRKLDLTKVTNGVLVAGFEKMYGAYKSSLNSVVSLGDRASLIVVDEAHQAIAPTYRQIVDTLATKQPKNALLGLTATPGRSWNEIDKDEELSDYFAREKVTLAVRGYPDPVSYLIAEGYLAKPLFRTLKIETDLPKAILRKAGADQEPSKQLLQLLSSNSHRNQKIVADTEELATRHSRIIVFGASVEHARLLTGLFTARGHSAGIITGETPVAQRRSAIHRFKSGNQRPMILCNYGVLTTGFDAPKTSAAVIARPTKSLVLYSQMVGRAIRGLRAGGNEVAEVVTVVDTTLPGFGSVTEAFNNWEDVWNEH